MENLPYLLVAASLCGCHSPAELAYLKRSAVVVQQPKRETGDFVCKDDRLFVSPTSRSKRCA
jgi:hypothetical protein